MTGNSTARSYETEKEGDRQTGIFSVYSLQLLILSALFPCTGKHSGMIIAGSIKAKGTWPSYNNPEGFLQWEEGYRGRNPHTCAPCTYRNRKGCSTHRRVVRRTNSWLHLPWSDSLDLGLLPAGCFPNLCWSHGHTENGELWQAPPHFTTSQAQTLVWFSSVKKKPFGFSFLMCSADRKNAAFILPSNFTGTAYESRHCKTRLEFFCPMLK